MNTVPSHKKHSRNFIIGKVNQIAEAERPIVDVARTFVNVGMLPCSLQRKYLDKHVHAISDTNQGSPAEAEYWQLKKEITFVQDRF